MGLDRLDCLRRISKGTAHFGVFSPEDLIAAQWAGVDVLITSEMRFNDGKCWLLEILFLFRFSLIHFHENNDLFV